MASVSASALETRAKMVELARRMLSGETDLFEGARTMAALGRNLTEAEGLDSDVLTFVAVDSELDDIPFGDARQRWAPDALKEKDRQRDDYLVKARPALEQACRAIATRYS